MTYFEAFQDVKDTFFQADVTQYQGHLAIQVNLTGEGEGAFYVVLHDGTLAVEPYEYYDRDVLFVADTYDFLAIVHGEMDPVAAFFDGKLQLEGDLGRALEIQQLISK